jgi:amino acid transporter
MGAHSASGGPTGARLARHPFVNLQDLVFGRRLRSSDVAHERIGMPTGVSVLGLDALSSAAYGPEVALLVLMPLGVVGSRALVPILACIVALLFIVFVSYRQTIRAYPNGGGSYIVAKQNLGERWGLLAAAALGLDYVLNVAVGISAGIAAVISAFPALRGHVVGLCLAMLVVLTMTNLRGIRSTGAAWRVPTWLFVTCLGLVLIIGAYKTITAGGSPRPIVTPPHLPPQTVAVGAWIMIRAFASGCAAMTGVEAVSNGVPLFHSPAVAERTLTTIISILAVLLLGIGLLCSVYHIGALDQTQPGYQSVLSQLVGAVAGRGWFYGITIAAVVAVLGLSANTSFADFPRVTHFLAADEFLPPSFGKRGRRLVYSQGIVVLAIISGLLLIGFRGVTDRLVQLFAIGAFIAFTLSQAGMVQHWRTRPSEPQARRKMIINATGAVFTGATALVLFISKFWEGAWATLILIPGLVLLLQAMHARHVAVDRAEEIHEPLAVAAMAPPVVVVPMLGWNRRFENALRMAMETSPDVRAVRIITEDAPGEGIVETWEAMIAQPARAAGRSVPLLDVVRSEFRQLVEPVVAYVQELARAHPDRIVEVVVPELADRRWYDFFVRNRYSEILRTELLIVSDSRVVVLAAPL